MGGGLAGGGGHVDRASAPKELSYSHLSKHIWSRLGLTSVSLLFDLMMFFFPLCIIYYIGIRSSPENGSIFMIFLLLFFFPLKKPMKHFQKL